MNDEWKITRRGYYVISEFPKDESSLAPKENYHYGKSPDDIIAVTPNILSHNGILNYTNAINES